MTESEEKKLKEYNDLSKIWFTFFASLKLTEISSYFQGTQFVASHGGQTSCENVRKGRLALLFQTSCENVRKGRIALLCQKCACQSDRFT